MRRPQCGSTDFIGGRYFRLTADSAATLRCICGVGERGLAAIRRYHRPVLLHE